MTFHQKLYDSEASAKSSVPKYANDGTWLYTDYEKHELEFDDWLAFCEPWDAHQMLLRPRKTIVLNVRWEPPAAGNEAVISVYGEGGPHFLRMRR